MSNLDDLFANAQYYSDCFNLVNRAPKRAAELLKEMGDGNHDWDFLLDALSEKIFDRHEFNHRTGVLNPKWLIFIKNLNSSGVNEVYAPLMSECSFSGKLKMVAENSSRNVLSCLEDYFFAKALYDPDSAEILGYNYAWHLEDEEADFNSLGHSVILDMIDNDNARTYSGQVLKELQGRGDGVTLKEALILEEDVSMFFTVNDVEAWKEEFNSLSPFEQKRIFVSCRHVTSIIQLYADDDDTIFNKFLPDLVYRAYPQDLISKLSVREDFPEEKYLQTTKKIIGPYNRMASPVIVGPYGIASKLLEEESNEYVSELNISNWTGEDLLYPAVDPGTRIQVNYVLDYFYNKGVVDAEDIFDKLCYKDFRSEEILKHFSLSNSSKILDSLKSKLHNVDFDLFIKACETYELSVNQTVVLVDSY